MKVHFIGAGPGDPELFAADERIVRGEMPEKSDYFSVLLARRRR